MSIKAAIEALDKATQGPWASDKEAPDWIWADRKGVAFHVADVRGWGTLQKEGQKGCDELSANIALIAAAPQMAALIKRMVPWLEAYKTYLQDEGVDNERHLAELDSILKEAGE